MRLSVSIVTYNHAEYIEQAVMSALNQDVSFDYEIFIGEDCSTDSTADVLRRLEASNPGRLNVIYREKNIGAADNFLKTIEACSGEYIAFLDGDDFWTSRNKLETQVAFLEQHQEASFCFHRTRYLFAVEQSPEYVLPLHDPPTLSSFDFLLQASNPVAINSIVARRAYLTDLSIWTANLKLGDWPLCLMLATHGPVGFVPMEMSRYRVHASGTWSRLSPYLQFAFVMQMLFHVSALMSGDVKKLVEHRKAEMADWWCGNLIHEPKVQLDAVVNDLDRVGSCELAHFLLSRTVESARDVEQARLRQEQQSHSWETAARWHEQQSHSWETAARWHEQQSHSWETAARWHEQQKQAWEATAAHATADASLLKREVTELDGKIAQLDAKVAELRKQMARMEVVIGARIRRWVAGFRRGRPA